jgi:hypothetical protein
MHALFGRSGIAQSVQRLGCELDDLSSILDKGKECFIFHNVYTDSGAQPNSYAQGSVASFTGGK